MCLRHLFTVFTDRWTKGIESDTLKKGDKHRGILQTVITSTAKLGGASESPKTTFTPTSRGGIQEAWSLKETSPKKDLLPFSYQRATQRVTQGHLTSWTKSR